ncbi:uncharacterized protein DS421_5g149050 [Arachis hypogaea]|nr:uncharacterized protein DS421_5g149050 [Arachis hypogaea]
MEKKNVVVVMVCFIVAILSILSVALALAAKVTRFTLVAAIFLLVIGAIFNVRHKKSIYMCSVVKLGVFATGGILTLATVSNGIA